MKFRDRIIVTCLAIAISSGCIAGCRDDHDPPPHEVEQIAQPPSKAHPKDLRAQVVDYLEKLKESEGLVRELTTRNFHLLYPKAVEVLLSMSRDENSPHRVDAIYALADGPLGPYEAEVLQFIRDSLKSDEGELRSAALDAMDIRNMAELDADLLKRMSKDPSTDVRRSVLTSIGYFSDLDVELLQIVVRGLEDTNDDVMSGAAFALKSLGPRALPVIEYLRQLTSADRPDVRAEAITALAGCGPVEEDLPRIFAACEDDDPSVRAHAFEALVRCPPEHAQVRWLGFVALEDSEYYDIRVAGVFALGRVSPTTSDIAKRLAEGMLDEDEVKEVRDACVRVLTNLGPAAEAAADAVAKQIADDTARAG